MHDIYDLPYLVGSTNLVTAMSLVGKLAYPINYTLDDERIQVQPSFASVIVPLSQSGALEEEKHEADIRVGIRPPFQRCISSAASFSRVLIVSS